MWVQLASWQTPSTCTGLTGIYELLLRRSPDLMNIRSRTPFELTFHLFLEKRCFSPRHCATNYTVHFSDIKGKSSIGKNNFARIVTTLLYDISTIMERNRKKKNRYSRKNGERCKRRGGEGWYDCQLFSCNEEFRCGPSGGNKTVRNEEIATRYSGMEEPFVLSGIATDFHRPFLSRRSFVSNVFPTMASPSPSLGVAEGSTG